MNFTTQQLVGGARYGGGVRIGNWDEDKTRLDSAAQDYEFRRERGELLPLRKARERSFQTHAAALTVAPEFRRLGLAGTPPGPGWSRLGLGSIRRIRRDSDPGRLHA